MSQETRSELPTAPMGAVGEMLSVALPVVAGTISFTIMQFVDKLMVSRIGADPVYVGAQGNGGLLAFVPMAVGMGLLPMVNTFVSQHLGNKTPEKGIGYVWAGLWLAAAYWLLVLVPIGVLLPTIIEWMRGMGSHEGTIGTMALRDRLAGEYGQVLLYGGVMTLGARAISQYFFGMHRPVVVLAAGVIANVSNLLLNLVLVFGADGMAGTGNEMVDAVLKAAAWVARELGIPALGLRGSGIATVIASGIELVIPMAVFLSKGYRQRFGTLAGWRPERGAMLDLLRTGWPGALMFGNEIASWAIFMVWQVGHFGAAHSTAGWIAHQYMSLSFMPVYGLSTAITSIVGKCIGMGRHDLARQRVWLGVKLSVGYMCLCGLVFVVFRRSLVGFFIEDQTDAALRAELITLGSRFLIAVAAFQFFDAVQMTLAGALRGAGDTRWPGVLTLVMSWTVIVGGGWVMIEMFPGLSSMGPWISAAAYVVLMALALTWRFVSGAWVGIDLLAREKA